MPVDHPDPSFVSSSAASVTRWSGLAVIVAGLIFAGIQPIHPADVLSSVTTDAWAIIQSLKLMMCYLFIIGAMGLYVVQANRVGWLGLIGFLLFGLSWALQSGFVFVEVFVLPVLANTSPEFVNSFLGIINGQPQELDLSASETAYGIVGVCYLLGGLLAGIATYRAQVLPRWPAGLFVLAALVTPAAALLPLHLQRYAAVPMGAAMIWLGIAQVAMLRARTT